MGDSGSGHWLVRMEWRATGWSVCLPLLIFPCTIKCRSSLLGPAHPGGPRERAAKRLWWCGGGSGTEPFTIYDTGFFMAGRSSRHPTNSAKAMKETCSTDATQWPGLILSSSTIEHLTEGALFPLCCFSYASNGEYNHT